jgi:L-fucose dehydrogenase
MDLHLKNHVILVSGGAKGIGSAICTLLLEEQAVPVILDKDGFRQSLRKEISQSSFHSGRPQR